MRWDKAARLWPAGRSREQLAQSEPAMTADQAPGDACSGIVFPPVVAEVVLVDIPMKVFWRNLMMNAKDRPLEQSEIPFGRVDMNPDAILGSGELLRRVIDAIVSAHLAAEPVVNGQLVSAENAGAIEPAKHQGSRATALAEGTTAARASPPRSIAAKIIGLLVPRP